MANYPGYSPQSQYGGPLESGSRNDVLAGLLLLIGGGAGVAQFFLPWASFEGIGMTGKDYYDGATAAGETLLGLIPLVILIAGGLLALFGILLFVPMRSRKPLGSIALIVSLVSTAAAVYLLVDSGADLSGSDYGLYLALGSGVVALLGSIKAVASR